MNIREVAKRDSKLCLEPQAALSNLEHWPKGTISKVTGRLGHDVVLSNYFTEVIVVMPKGS
jgi:hypothetical protein